MKRLTYKICILSTVLMLISIPIFAQNIIPVEAGQNTVLDAMATAQEGDIIELTTSGGEYWNDDEIRITFPVTIRAATGLQERPVLMNNSDENTKDIIRLYDSCTLIGLELNGNAGIDSLLVKYAIRTADTGSEVKQNYVFKAYDCYFQDVIKGSDGNAFRAYARTLADTILFSGCTFINMGKEAIRLRDEESERPEFGFYSVKYFEANNCTFAHIIHDAISIYAGDSAPETPGPVVRLNHLTLDDCGHYGLSLKYVSDAVVKNSIITNNLDVVGNTGNTNGGPWLTDEATITHCDTLNIGGKWTGGNPTATNILHVDPQYADAANYDFTLAETSPVRGQADDGFAMGDLRWSGELTSVSDSQKADAIGNRIFQNYPNPFHTETTLNFLLQRSSHVRMQVFDIRGRLVANLINGPMPAGENELQWNATDLAAGVYFYSLEIDGRRAGLKKAVLIK